MINLKNDLQLAKMRSAGHLLYDVLRRTKEIIAPGITTMDINRFVDEQIRKGRAIPTELGYCGYPASICASIDDEVVHGIPSKHVRLEEGSIISIDVPDEIIINRLSGRRVCAACGGTFHVSLLKGGARSRRWTETASAM